MKKDASVLVEHILESIELIEQYLKGKSKIDFMGSTQLQDSVIRRIEIIGEAVRNIPDDIKSKYQDIRWKEISGMRDILIHKYFGLDLELTWEAAVKDIPDLKEKILRIKKS
ncbi:MAG TPA: hypothetical protein DEO84_02105 [candidate division Zixibacteria bacterium]|jgi:uncharacterized protein with HEPN domain|nr:hypothetical protein [candidate division Zixibacteria bacterium]HBZ00090.1 hypothetical protein [candidate division Zixibacteria bacterium]